MMAQLGLADQPKAETPKAKVQRSPKANLPEFVSGDVIVVNGTPMQISADGKRLNKTIV